MTELDENFENEYNPRIKKILFIGFAILYIRLCGIYKNKQLVIGDVMKEAYRLPVRQDKSEDDDEDKNEEKSEEKYEDEYNYIELITDRINITVNNIIKDSDKIREEYIKTVEFLLYNFDLEKTKKIITAIKTEIKKEGDSGVPPPLSLPNAAPSSYSGSSHTPFFSSSGSTPLSSGSTPPIQQPFGYSQNSTNYHPSNGTVERAYVGGKKIRKNKVI